MWEWLNEALARLRARPKIDPQQRRAAKARARFWQEVREGEREAEVQSQAARVQRDPPLTSPSPSSDGGGGIH